LIRALNEAGEGATFLDFFDNNCVRQKHKKKNGEKSDIFVKMMIEEKK